MSVRPRFAPFSRLDPIKWPAGTGIALFFGWIAYGVAINILVHPLIWTVLPLGLTLYLVAERYPWRVILLLVLPLTVLTAISQVVSTWSDAPTWTAFGIYLIACASFSLVVCGPDRDRWIARLPSRLLGDRFEARLAWTRFEESLVAANAAVRHISEGEDPAARHAEMRGIAMEARRECRRGGIWRAAWAAQATWLEALDALVGREPSADQGRHIRDLLEDLDGAHMLAIARTGEIDPAP